MKADVLRIPKMWYFLDVRLFKGELLAVIVGSFFNFFGQQNAVLQKKRHSHNFDFSEFGDFVHLWLKDISRTHD